MHVDNASRNPQTKPRPTFLLLFVAVELNELAEDLVLIFGVDSCATVRHLHSKVARIHHANLVTCRFRLCSHTADFNIKIASRGVNFIALVIRFRITWSILKVSTYSEGVGADDMTASYLVTKVLHGRWAKSLNRYVIVT